MSFDKGIQLCRLPCSLDSKESACNAGDPDSVPGWGRFPVEGNGKPLQYSCMKNPMGRQWFCKESDSTERLSLSLPSLGQAGLAFGGSAPQRADRRGEAGPVGPLWMHIGLGMFTCRNNVSLTSFTEVCLHTIKGTVQWVLTKVSSDAAATMIVMEANSGWTLQVRCSSRVHAPAVPGCWPAL